MAVVSRISSADIGVLAVVARAYPSASERTETDYALHSEIRMSKRDFKLFLVTLDSDEEPCDKLKALAED